MSVSDGQRGNAATLNAAFQSRTVDTSTSGKQDFTNPAAESGPSVINIQREVNSLNSYTGRVSGSNFDALPIWVDTSVGSPTDNLTERAEALTVEAGDINSYIAAVEAAFNAHAADSTGVHGITDTADLNLKSTLTTKGDLYVRNATVVTRQPVGADGFVLTADSGEATGMKWAAPGAASFESDQNILANQVFS